MTTRERLEQLRNHLARFRFNYRTELELQNGIEAALIITTVVLLREVTLSDVGRLDFLIDGDLVIETKIGGSAAELMRQIARYAKNRQIVGILVVTDRSSHRMPPEFSGKPVLVHSLMDGAF